ncbi:flagellar basal body-associated FliL family protein [Paracoccus luteus]|uniref:flagellar basal body-associated FliL family protein n=1 Tax=Paracoccus luteus TaxID=2508543 RepID=UPI0010700E36|nr:flagellar basal body-associated FliL family protein [Paracoccus luteus]
MTDITDPSGAAPPRSRLGRLLPVLIAAAALAGGMGTTYLGLWSPMALLAGGDKPADHAAPAGPGVVFVDVPRIVLTIPGPRPKSLALTALIEVDPASESQARALMPRVTDAFNSFLSDIDPAAFERRGILEIIRLELATRARFVLGDAALRDLLITEFRIQ